MDNSKASFKEKLSEDNINQINSLSDYFENSIGTTADKLDNFSKYITRTSMSRFLTKYEIFKKILDVQGCIIECGVLFGGGLMSWAHFSSILEPANHQRRIFGFDTFEGFPNISSKDKSKSSSIFCKDGELCVDSEEDLKIGISIYDKTRYFNNVPKVNLIRGDVENTVPKFLEENQQIIVSLLYLDFDIYTPTKICLRSFLPRMPKGSIIAFDQLNNPQWPGETRAVYEVFGGEFNKIKIKKIPVIGTSISYLEV